MSRVLQENCAAIIIDIQEKLIPHIHANKDLIQNCQIFIQGLNLLDIPLILTEQYAKGLGSTIDSIKQFLPEKSPLDKMSFSCCDADNFRTVLEKLQKRTVIVIGIEAHVCVLQTVLDLVDQGYQPVVIADCISSRKLSDKEYALQRMAQCGAIISSYESMLFELCRVSGTEQFKIISKLVK